ncbi:hypothetical protein BC941DRAFT_334984, partial [Chlamydoabsidia padenii]
VKTMKSFWSAPMRPHARTIWYRVLSSKLPLQHLLAKAHSQDPHCIHCHRHEDVAHFVYYCPVKRRIWDTVLARHLPLHLIQHQDYTDFIIYLRAPPPHLPLVKAFTIFSEVLVGIWSNHWSYKLHSIPFDEHRIVRSINTSIISLLS